MVASFLVLLAPIARMWWIYAIRSALDLVIHTTLALLGVGLIWLATQRVHMDYVSTRIGELRNAAYGVSKLFGRRCAH